VPGAPELLASRDANRTCDVSGKPIKLTTGMVASIRSTDHVVHRAGPTGAKALVIWAPGGDIARVTARWKAQ
jgi:hypothetical protein